jgi:hypothetical protein
MLRNITQISGRESTRETEMNVFLPYKADKHGQPCMRSIHEHRVKNAQKVRGGDGLQWHNMSNSWKSETWFKSLNGTFICNTQTLWWCHKLTSFELQFLMSKYQWYQRSYTATHTWKCVSFYTFLRINGTVLGKQMKEVRSSEATQLLRALASAREVPLTWSSSLQNSRQGFSTRGPRAECDMLNKKFWKELRLFLQHKYFIWSNLT